MVQKLNFDGDAAVALSVPGCTLRYYIILLGSVSVQVWMGEYNEICGNIGVHKESQYQSIAPHPVWECNWNDHMLNTCVILQETIARKWPELLPTQVPEPTCPAGIHTQRQSDWEPERFSNM